METVIIKMTDSYDYQAFYKNISPIHIIDCRDIAGTRCYCDDAAKDQLTSRIEPFSPSGIHFIDSGNYHYLTLLWLEKIDYDFSLVLFDHHPDDQPPSFGDILSCGGWVLKAKETLPHLKNVYTYGVSEPPAFIDDKYPIFISIDKDVLSIDDSITDWDQGDMTLLTLKNTLSDIFSNNKIIGIDICGDSGEKAQEASVLNNQTNSFLFDFLSQNF